MDPPEITGGANTRQQRRSRGLRSHRSTVELPLIFTISFAVVTLLILHNLAGNSVPRPPLNTMIYSTLSGYNVEQEFLSFNERDVCFSWEDGKAADEWWTHRPWYEVTIEHDDGFCFSQPKNATKRAFMKKLYENQFHGNCSNVISRNMASSGWGYDFISLADALWKGMNESRPVEMVLMNDNKGVWQKGSWHYAGLKDGSKPTCSSSDMYCYMLNMTNCRAAEDPKDMILPRKFTPLPGFDLHVEWLVEYETRIQSWLRKEVYDFFNTRIQMQTPCTVIHARRSDIKGHGLRKYHAIKEYVDNMEKVNKGKMHKNILLLSDDQNAIEEAQRDFPDKNWMFFNRTRFRGTEGGWENHFPTGDPKTEVVTLLSTFKAVKYCDSFSRQEGNFADLLLSHMEYAHGKGNVTVATFGTFGFS